jgi:hypothetical protein
MLHVLASFLRTSLSQLCIKRCPEFVNTFNHSHEVRQFRIALNPAMFTNNSCVWLNVFTCVGHLFTCSTNKRSLSKTWNGAYEKILESTGTGEWTHINKRLCDVTVCGLSIGEFYNSKTTSKSETFLIVVVRPSKHFSCVYLHKLTFNFSNRGKPVWLSGRAVRN